ncbi:MAG: enoyl-CoA hydratase-related protein, partial [bacterium]
CDIRLAGRSAHFGQPEVSLGIMAAAGGTYRLARLVGLGKAKELLFTGDIIDAEEARRIGLVNRVVDDEGVVAAARAMATRIVSLDPLAVRVTKLSVNALARGETAQTVETLAQAILFESPGKRERMTAFLSKKKK